MSTILVELFKTELVNSDGIDLTDALSKATSNGDYEIVKLLITEFKKTILACEEEFRDIILDTCFEEAQKKGFVEILKILCKEFKDFYADKNITTALNNALAIKINNFLTANTISLRGFDNAFDATIALCEQIRNKTIDSYSIMKALYKNIQNKQLYHFLIEEFKTEIATTDGIELNKILLKATKNNNFEAINLLITEFKDNIRSYEKNSLNECLEVALLKTQSPQVTKLLFETFKDFYTQDKEYIDFVKKAFYENTGKKNTAFSKYLTELFRKEIAGSGATKLNKALLFATKHNNAEEVEYLIKKFKNEIASCQHNTLNKCLEIALLKSQSLQIIKLLFEAFKEFYLHDKKYVDSVIKTFYRNRGKTNTEFSKDLAKLFKEEITGGIKFNKALLIATKRDNYQEVETLIKGFKNKNEITSCPQNKLKECFNIALKKQSLGVTKLLYQAFKESFPDPEINNIIIKFFEIFTTLKSLKPHYKKDCKKELEQALYYNELEHGKQLIEIIKTDINKDFLHQTLLTAIHTENDDMLNLLLEAFKGFYDEEEIAKIRSRRTR